MDGQSDLGSGDIMLNHHALFHGRVRGMRRQDGVVMMVALVVLVIMTLAGIALMRSMDTTNLIAGNMAFKQSTTASADTGVEAAIGWLELQNAIAGSPLDSDSAAGTGGWYHADGAGPAYTDQALAPFPLGDAYWRQLTLTGKCNLPIAGGVCSAQAASNASGNSISLVVHRLCTTSGHKGTTGVFCPTVAGSIRSDLSNEGPENDQLAGVTSSVYYRITVRVEGPRNAVSFVQATVAL
jgi:type IV pilus assembly protein PilX